MINEKKDKKVSLFRRFMMVIAVIIVVLAVPVLLAVRQAKVYERSTSIYFKSGTRDKLMDAYDQVLDKWPVSFVQHYIDTSFGKVHVIESGNSDGSDLVLFHASSTGSISWRDNVEKLGEDYHIFAIDILGEGNRSELADINRYPQSSEEVAGLYDSVFMALGIVKPSIIGASYGGFVTLNYAYHFPQKIDKVVLSGPMGISKSVGKTVAILTFYTFFPYEIFNRPITEWSFGNYKSDLMNEIQNYFSIILDGVLGRYYIPRTLGEDFLQQIEPETLLILGTNDPLVGDPEAAGAYASNIPNLKYKILESGHLINVEKSQAVNGIIMDFLRNE